jgi:hypothetical protein
MAEGGVLTIETANATLDRGAALAQDAAVPGDYVVVSVTDTGTGMAPEIVEKAIQPFFTTKDVGHGSGLGLSMVYGFVKQSGGHLDISSSAGQGTAVRLYLPKAEANAREGETQAPGPAATDGSGERILVVEDKADVRRLATRILTRRPRTARAPWRVWPPAPRWTCCSRTSCCPAGSAARTSPRKRRPATRS